MRSVLLLFFFFSKLRGDAQLKVIVQEVTLRRDSCDKLSEVKERHGVKRAILTNF